MFYFGRQWICGEALKELRGILRKNFKGGAEIVGMDAIKDKLSASNAILKEVGQEMMVVKNQLAKGNIQLGEK